MHQIGKIHTPGTFRLKDKNGCIFGYFFHFAFAFYLSYAYQRKRIFGGLAHLWDQQPAPRQLDTFGNLRLVNPDRQKCDIRHSSDDIYDDCDLVVLGASVSPILKIIARFAGRDTGQTRHHHFRHLWNHFIYLKLMADY